MENRVGVGLEITANPLRTQDFVPVKWQRYFGLFKFSRRLDKDHEKTTARAQAWIL